MTLPQPSPKQGGTPPTQPPHIRRRSLPKVVSLEEAQAWLKSPTNARDRALVSLAYSTAARVSELVAARLEDVDASRGRILLRRRKTQDQHEVALGRSLVRLQRYLRSTGRAFETRGPLFLSRHNRPLSKRQAQRIVTQAALDAGIARAKAHAHTLRHSRLTHLYEATGDLLLCQALAGHASINTTTVYAHLSRGRLDRLSTEHDL